MTDKPAMEDFLLPERLARIDRVLAQRTRSLVVVLEDMEDPHNVCAVLRTCESFGVQEVHAIARRYEFEPTTRITQGCEKWLDLFIHRQVAEPLLALRERGFLLAATALGEGSGSLLDLPLDRPLALVFGNERDGISDEALALCQTRFQIPMQGFSQSLNVSVAVAICVSHLVLHRLQARGTAGDLSESDRAQLRERFCALAVKQRGRILDPQSLENLKPDRASKRRKVTDK